MRSLRCAIGRHRREQVDPGDVHALDYCDRCGDFLPTLVYDEVMLGYACGVFDRRPWSFKHAQAYERIFSEPFPGEVA